MATVALVLASSAELPAGDLGDRLELAVRLTPPGLLDEAAFAARAAPWTARRTRADGKAEMSEVVRTEEGWALHEARSEDAPLWLLEGHFFRPGELVSLRRPDGEELVFRIVGVEDDEA
jgi:hypothetical protein